MTQSSRAGTHVWSGAVNGNWSLAGNWSSGGAPTVGEADVIVHFPSGASRQVTTNNIVGLSTDTIRITGNGYRLYGNSVTLTPTAANGTNVVMAPGGIGAFILLPLALPAGSYSVYVDAFASLELSGVISGAGGLVKYGEGLLTLAGDLSNPFTGGFSQLGGEVELYKSSGYALAGPVFIGASNSSLTYTMTYKWHHQIADVADVHVWGREARLELDGHNDTIRSLDLIDSEVWTSSISADAGVLRLNGNVTATQEDNTGNWVPHIFGRLSLGDTQHNFNIATNSVLTIYSRIESATTNGGITLVGEGVLSLYGSNIFTGPVRVQKGALSVNNSDALGSTVGSTILEGGEMSVSWGQTIPEPLDVRTNTLVRMNHTNQWNGPIIIRSNATLRIYGPSLGDTDELTLGGPISGEGGLALSSLKVNITGSSGNTFSGLTEISGHTVVHMSKTSGTALAGTVRLSRGSYIPQLYWDRSHQVADSARVIFQDSYSWDGPETPAELYLSNYNDTIGSLEYGRLAVINCGTGILTVGANNLDCTYTGGIFAQSGATNIIKVGTGKLILAGSNALAGKILVSTGTLILSNATGIGPVHLNSGVQFVGNGSLGTLTATAPTYVQPGTRPVNASYGTLQPASINLSGSYLSMGIGGTNAGAFDQITTPGPLNLTGVNLQLSAQDLPHGSNKITLINVTGGASVTGTFVGLPEGTIFPSSDGKSFRITYKGGNGNDVVVTRHYTISPSGVLTGVTPMVDGRMRIGGSGLPFEYYRVMANTNLSTGNWIDIGSVSSGDETGTLEFIDNDAGNFPMRFYRFVLP